MAAPPTPVAPGVPPVRLTAPPALPLVEDVPPASATAPPWAAARPATPRLASEPVMSSAVTDPAIVVVRLAAVRST
jgi:hypothetical protein